MLESGTIRDAMLVIDGNGREVVLVRDETESIVGLVTDGDIRRGLLAGLTLESRVTSVLVRDFHFVSPNIDRAAVLDLMKARMFRHVPVLRGSAPRSDSLPSRSHWCNSKAEYRGGDGGRQGYEALAHDRDNSQTDG